jgi:hypothetical protein
MIVIAQYSPFATCADLARVYIHGNEVRHAPDSRRDSVGHSRHLRPGVRRAVCVLGGDPERPGKTPEQLAVEYAAWLRRRRLAYRIVFGVLSIWALAVVAVFVFS